MTAALSKADARALDKRVRATSNRVAADIGKLLDLLDDAVTGDIHAALGCTSAAVWIHDAVQIAPAYENARKMLVALVADKRLSPAAIAGMFTNGAAS